MRVFALVLLVLLLVSLSPLVIVGEGRAVVLMDERTGFIDWRDLKSFSVWDNGTHILLKWEWWGPRPEYTGEGSCPVDVWGEIGLDLDNNRYTGMYAGNLWYSLTGSEIYLWVEIYCSEVIIYAEAYRGNDESVGFVYQPNWLASLTDDSLTIAIPLDWIRSVLDGIDLSPGTTIAVLQGDDDSMGASLSVLPRTLIEGYVVPYAEISLDGGDSDWGGVGPLFVNTETYLTGVIGAEDFREVYLASDNQTLYFAVRLGSPPYPGVDGYNDWQWSFSVNFHVGDTIYMVSVSTEKSRYPEIRGIRAYGATGLETGFVEFACNPSSFALPPDMAGRTVTVEVGSAYLRTLDNMGTSGYTRIFYTMGGRGGYVADSIDYYTQFIYPGTRDLDITLGDLNLTISTSGPAWIKVVTYNDDPIGNNTRPARVTTSNYYAIWFNNPDSVEWPIHLEINVQGLEEPVLYYYNKTSGEYTPVADQYYDPDKGIITANYTLQEYMAGDDPVIVAIPPAPPPTIGGELGLQTPRTTTILATLLITLLALLIPLTRKLRH